jgi:hypothetical protein
MDSRIRIGIKTMPINNNNAIAYDNYKNKNVLRLFGGGGGISF